MINIRGPVASVLRLLTYFVVSCHISSPIVRGQQANPKTSLPPGTTAGVGKAKLADSPVEVLGGRLTVRMPQGAKIAARPFHIMGAPEPEEHEEHETRIVFDAGQERLVLMAEESFAFAGNIFEKDVKECNDLFAGFEPIEL